MPLENLGPEDRDVLYELYALGLLEADEMAEVRARVEAGDPEAARGVARALQLTSAMAYLAPEQKPAKNLRRRLLLAAGAPERGFGWQWIGGLAAVAAALAVIVFNMRQDVGAREARILALERELSTAKVELAQVNELYEFLRQPATVGVKFGVEQNQPPRGQVFLNRERGVLLLAANLPAMPAGKIFEMWLVPKGGGAPVPAGLFRAANGQGVHFRSGPVDLANVAAVAVTLEPEAGSTVPSPPILFAAPVAAE
jgi:anti-sigma-K factor RskA